MPRTAQQFYDELLEQAQAADDLGFDSFWIAEHHFHEYGAIPRPPIWMAAAAQRTSRIKLGAAVSVLPFDNPLRTAEDYAMVDIMSGGRLTIGVGSGYLKHEFDGFGIDSQEKRERFDECLDILLLAWKGEPFSYEGKHHRVKDVTLNVTPLQEPHPPVSVAVLRNEAAPFVGAKGLSIMMIPYATTDNLSELCATTDAYRKALAPQLAESGSMRLQFGLHTHCAETTRAAREEAQGPMDRYVRTRLYAKQRPFDTLIEKDLIAAGDPDEISRVASLYANAGMTDFLAITNFGAMPHEKVLKSMELMASHVLPKFSDKIAGDPGKLTSSR